MNRKLLSLIQTQKGLALISVLAMVTLATVIVLALFSVSDSEFKASKVYAGGNAARQLADSAVNIVIGQIRTATNIDSTPRIWSSQPGAIRIYNDNGSFFRGYRLYSDGTMIVSGAGGDGNMTNDAPPSNWNNLPDQYVDLNEPVVRSLNGGQASVFFPVVDPRAADGNNPVEGFSYTANPVSGGAIDGVVTPTSAAGNNLRLPMPVEWLYVLKDGSLGTINSGGSWVSAAGAGQPSETNPIRGRIAFWTDDESCRININTASEPGYWALPTFYHDRDKGWADCPPAYQEYQRFPGHPATVALSTVLYPGPSGAPRFLDTYAYAGSHLSANRGIASSTDVLNIKNRIYQVVPKINGGGSLDGTLVFELDDTIATGKANPVELVTANPRNSPKLERLYASLDEMLFSEKMSSSKRVENDFGGLSGVSITPTTFEKTRFFMSAHSRAPELNMFSRPRIAMWPVPDSTLGEPYRTGYDRAIATVATLGTTSNASGNTYYFSRKDADSAIADIGHDHGGSTGLSRNQKLMLYLDALTSSTFPGGQSFAGKYGLDARQILVEIFDYIRCTNLYDSFLAPRFNATPTTDEMDYRWQPSPPRTVPNDDRTPVENEPGKTTDDFKLDELMNFKRADTQNGMSNGALSGPRLYRTYTEPRFKVTKFRWHDSAAIDLQNEVVASGVYPGHGQVTPAEWTIDNRTFRGFGRFPTISEIGLQFICTGDALNDEGSYNVTGDPFDPNNPYKPGISGGRTAEKINYTLEDQRQNNAAGLTPNGKDYWYSNYPPFPDYPTLQLMGVSGAGRGPASASIHPACDSENWNATLARNKPLLPGQKRIQMAIVLEFFVPSMGFTKYAPEFTAVLNGEQMNGIKVKIVDPANPLQEKWESVFNTTGNQVLKSNHNFIGGTDGLGDNSLVMNPMGGSSGAKNSMLGRAAKGIDQMPEDKGYDTAASSEEHAGWKNYPLLSSFFTVLRDKPLEFKIESPLQIDIYDDHNWQRQQPSQSLEVKFPESSEAPQPELVRYSTEKRRWEDASNGTIHTLRAVDACRWWAFHYRGALCNWEGRITISGTSVDTRNVKPVPDKTVSGQNDKYVRTRGRFETLGHNSIQPLDPYAVQVNGSSGKVPANSIFYGFSSVNGFNGTKSREQDRANFNIYTVYPGLTNRRTEMGDYGFYGSDTVRSLVPKYGDYRLLAARKTVPSDMWVPHPLWDSRDSFFAHNFGAHLSNQEPGYHLGGNSDLTADPTNRLVQNREYGSDRQFIPDMPHTQEARDAAARYRDFDNGPSNSRDGAYINKPDEGNLSVIYVYQHTSQRRIRNAYFHDSYMQLPASESYFTPNRMISSPGMLGSLPTGVFGSKSNGLRDRGAHGDPWRTLLFRADTSISGAHPGAPPPNGSAPADHYYMDLFWMPVIEPYAISDQWATAGKINMNFQIVPFTYIQRATGMYAAMKGELITAVPSTDSQMLNVRQRKGSNQTKSYKQYKDISEWPPLFFNEVDGKYWHRYIDLEKTTAQMKYRMDGLGSPATSGLFRTASQICEIYLVPQTIPGIVSPNVGSPANAAAGMKTFWDAHAITGDNTRERPYANLYQKLTTRSNTFRVYYRAQSLRKAARSLAPTQVSTTPTAAGAADTVEAEYRGSALIERYLDMSASGIPDYTSGNPLSGANQSLDAFYRYRVLESKQFAP